ncbi:hypothetical protein [Rubellimicrobium sp. CFH 75288]|uniref:hypothetical protein n=1 Tax=Rubellimicrobium sp. CFH 75288 TaxID=2697034 RepID=UPI001412BD47|nr:hypothetical protein [Rubellimicrobium sp. CFH 75288]NAZ38167.1 hypothetical protein [Rubellimicrobium sp. CFH 75288]
MNITFPAEFRAAFPDPRDLSLQSLWVFNMYRAASSVVAAAAVVLAQQTGRVPNNVTRIFYTAGVEPSDMGDWTRSSVFLRDGGAPLLALCDIGGWLNFGFREVPLAFSEAFSHVGAAVLVVRDPRDIGISHYSAVKKHSMDNRVEEGHIGRLRALTNSLTLEEYLLQDATVAFLNRIATCYRPMIDKGVRVLRYEDMFADGAFRLDRLWDGLFDAFRPFGPPGWDRDAFRAAATDRVQRSESLKGHGTGGGFGMYERLPDAVRARYEEALAPALDALGYR